MRASGKKNKNRAAVSNKSGRRRCHENYRLQMTRTQVTKIRLGSACAAVATAVMENGECASLFPSF